MRIKHIKTEKFKRFTDLTIKNIPNTAKLVVLIGPNGCGKSSLFDAFKTWHLEQGYHNVASNDYCKKDISDTRSSYELVGIDFHEDISKSNQQEKQSFFYFRTAYRNSPNVNVTALQKLDSPLETADNKMMTQNDSTVDDNYQRLISKTLSKVYDINYDGVDVKTLREELISKIREPLKRLFPDLLLKEIGMPTEKAEFYFQKGTTEKYGYEKLSGGEKATFDLLLDMVIKSEFYSNTIFCIDEPETHIHTKLQASLLRELFQLIPEESQLWISTHSFGMLKEAKKLHEEYSEKIVFLNFDEYDFDDTIIIEPSSCDSTIWHKMLEISLDDHATLMSPRTIIFCEGTIKGRKHKDFDAKCYETIFKSKRPDVMFYSLGSCNDIESEKNAVVEFISRLSPNSNVIRLIDRDDRSEEEIEDLKQRGIKVLCRRHIESYLLDDEVIKKWCVSNEKEALISDCINIKTQKIQDSIQRGNPSDDIKSAGNDICTTIKKTLGITRCGNTGETILRDTLSKHITEDMPLYKELEDVIFSS